MNNQNPTNIFSRDAPMQPGYTVKFEETKNIFNNDHPCTTAPLGNPAYGETSLIDNWSDKFISLIKQEYHRIVGNIPELNINTFGEIKRVTEDIKIDRDIPGKVEILCGIHPFELASMDISKNGVIQVDSQFNFLDSDQSVPLSYVMRNFQFKHRDTGVNFFNSSYQDYQSGNYYLPVDNLNADNEYTVVRNNLDNLPILIQDGFDIFEGNLVTQVFRAEPTFHEEPLTLSKQSLIYQTLLYAQYESIARVAIHKSIVTGAEVPLHLIPCKYDKYMLVNAIRIIGGHNVKIYIHLNKEEDIENLSDEILSYVE